MQITIEITEEEYTQIEMYTRRVLVMAQDGITDLTIADKILRRLCVAVGENIRKAQQNKERDK